MNAIKRLVVMFQLYAVDITIKGQDECLACISDPILSFKITVARMNARRERTRLRGQYNALLPVGQRKTWSMA